MIASLTRSPGTAALAAAAGWLAVLVAFLVMAGDLFEEWEPLYNVTAVVGLVVGLATIVALNGLLAAAVREGDSWSKVALVLAALGVGMIAIGTWATPLWSALFSASSVIAVLRLRAAALDLRTGSWAFIAAWPVSFGLFVLLDAIKLGRVDGYGDYPWAGGIGTAVWCGLFAVGLWVYGRWLRSRDASEAAMALPATF